MCTHNILFPEKIFLNQTLNLFFLRYRKNSLGNKKKNEFESVIVNEPTVFESLKLFLQYPS